ncbi:MAG: ROK family protein [Planctomycetota bacterium]|nr:MAG: ROK family protein [Planctomycetota bacterium]
MPDPADAPATLIADSARTFAAGVDLGGTNIQAGILNPKAKVLGRAKAKTAPESGFDAVVDRIIRTVRAACEDAQVPFESLSCLGVGTPGPVDPATGIVLEAVNLRWDNAPLRKALIDKTGLDVVIENDVNAAVYGEWKRGAGKGATDLLGVWVGTGVGGGLVLRGQPFMGHFHTAGEIGHMILVPGAAPGSRSLEHNCSRTAVAERIARLIRANRKSSLAEVVNDGKRIKSKMLADAYHSGDELVCEVINDSADRLGMAIGSVVTLLSLQRVVIGGGLTEALGEPYVSRIRAATIRAAFPKAVKKVEVVESALGDDAGIIGAAIAATDHLGV